MHSGLICVDDCWLQSSICSLLQSLSLPPSLSPSLHQSALHWGQHVEENCKCAELCECVYPVCAWVSGSERSDAREEIGLTPGSACIAALSVRRVSACEYACACVHTAMLSRASRCLCPLLAGIMSRPRAALRLRECGVGSGLQRVGWRAGAAGRRGRSAPSATRAASVKSTRVSTAMAKH